MLHIPRQLPEMGRRGLDLQLSSGPNETRGYRMPQQSDARCGCPDSEVRHGWIWTATEMIDINKSWGFTHKSLVRILWIPTYLISVLSIYSFHPSHFQSSPPCHSSHEQSDHYLQLAQACSPALARGVAPRDRRLSVPSSGHYSTAL